MKDIRSTKMIANGNCIFERSFDRHNLERIAETVTDIATNIDT